MPRWAIYAAIVVLLFWLLRKGGTAAAAKPAVQAPGTDDARVQIQQPAVSAYVPPPPAPSVALAPISGELPSPVAAPPRFLPTITPEALKVLTDSFAASQQGDLPWEVTHQQTLLAAVPSIADIDLIPVPEPSYVARVDGGASSYLPPPSIDPPPTDVWDFPYDPAQDMST